MRPVPAFLLLATSWGLSHCTAPNAEAPPVAAVPAAVHTSVSSGVSTGGVGPDPAQRPALLENVVAGGAAYAATLPVLREADGTIRLRVAVNPRAHTLDTVRVLFAPHGPGARYSQMGRGVGKYDAKTGRYYFNATYQKVRDTADGGSFGDDPQEIAGWVHPGTNTAALVHRVAQ